MCRPQLFIIHYSLNSNLGALRAPQIRIYLPRSKGIFSNLPCPPKRWPLLPRAASAVLPCRQRQRSRNTLRSGSPHGGTVSCPGRGLHAARSRQHDSSAGFPQAAPPARKLRPCREEFAWPRHIFFQKYFPHFHFTLHNNHNYLYSTTLLPEYQTLERVNQKKTVRKKLQKFAMNKFLPKNNHFPAAFSSFYPLTLEQRYHKVLYHYTHFLYSKRTQRTKISTTSKLVVCTGPIRAAYRLSP